MDLSTNINQIQPLPEYLPYPEDFEYSDDIFNEDSEQILRIKWIIDNKLSVGEKDIFLLYVHNDSNYHKLSRILGCSVTCARYKILSIRKKIIDNL